MINPTIALSAPSGLNERRILAQRYHIHTVLTGRWPREFSLSQNAEIDESIIILTRNEENQTPTRFVQLDTMPVDESEVADLHQCLTHCSTGLINNGWGEVSEWPADRIAAWRLDAGHLEVSGTGRRSCLVCEPRRPEQHQSIWPVSPRDRPVAARLFRASSGRHSG